MLAAGLPYNGWSEHVRHGRDKHYYHARDNGLLPQATECLCCGFKFKGVVPYHAEEYGPTLEDYWAACVALCHRCHAMLHARFKTPNLWKKYLAQASCGEIDEAQFPNGSHIAPLLSKFKSREDESYIETPQAIHDYFLKLSPGEYSGVEKVATLLVVDLASGERREVPDWTLYGVDLSGLSAENRETLRRRNIDVDGFGVEKFDISRSSAGEPRYKKLYAPRRA